MDKLTTKMEKKGTNKGNLQNRKLKKTINKRK